MRIDVTRKPKQEIDKIAKQMSAAFGCNDFSLKVDSARVWLVCASIPTAQVVFQRVTSV
jgi:hypothetical protein